MALPGGLPQLNDLVPVGTTHSFAGAVAPAGYLLCDGAAISRTAYPKLFGIIGTTHGGGDGVTTFNIPDYRGRFLRGVDGVAGNDPDKLSRSAMAGGGNTGNAVGSVQGQATAKNGLSITDPGHSHTLHVNATNGNAGTGEVYQTQAYSHDNTTSVVSATTGVSLGAGNAETRPVNANVNFIIKF